MDNVKLIKSDGNGLTQIRIAETWVTNGHWMIRKTSLAARFQTAVHTVETAAVFFGDAAHVQEIEEKQCDATFSTTRTGHRPGHQLLE